VFCVLAVAWTWPVGAYLSSRIPNDPGDPVLNTYLLAWNALKWPFTPGWWNPPFFYPMPGALALSEHLAGLAPVSTPVQIAGGSAVLAYNLSFLLSYALSAWFAYLLVRRLTGSMAVAFCAGLAYGFAPFRAGQLAHLQVLTSQWLPLLLLAMHAWLEDSRTRWLVLAGAAWALQGLANGYYLLFAPVLITLWLAWFPDWRRKPRQALALAGALAASSLLFVPVLIQYRAVHQELGLTRGAIEIVNYSARPSSFLNPPPPLAFWPTRNVRAVEDLLFPGVTVVAVILAAVVVAARRDSFRSAIRTRSPLLFYSVAAVVMSALTLGPGDPDAGPSRWIRPYFWLTQLPGYDSVRVPPRFAMLGTLCLSVAAGLALARLLPSRRMPRAALVAAVAAGLVVDGWIEPVPLQLPPGRQMLEAAPAGAAVLEVPPDEILVNTNAMYRALFHRRPLINGYSGHIPPHYDILGQSLRRDDPSGVLELARGRPLVILVSDRFDPAGDFRRLVESLPGVSRLGSGSAGTIYVLPAQPRERVALSGARLPLVYSRLPHDHALVDLGADRTIRTIAFPLRWHYPELGSRIAIEGSADGDAWTPIWEGWTAGAAIAGALENPRLVPFRIPLPDVQTRYLRIHPAPDWMMREMTLVGP
jgi:hypothetical protein